MGAFYAGTDFISGFIQRKFQVISCQTGDAPENLNTERGIEMENITKTLTGIDSRLLIESMEIIIDGDSRAVFLSAIVPFFADEAELEEIHYEILEKIRSLDANFECCISLKTAAAA